MTLSPGVLDVTYRAVFVVTDATDPEWVNWLREGQTEPMTLEDVCEACQAAKCVAQVYDQWGRHVANIDTEGNCREAT